MVLTHINAKNVAHLHFDDILDVLRTAPRPIKLQFLSAPARPGSVEKDEDGRTRRKRPTRKQRHHRSKSPVARRSTGLVSKTFQEGQIGIEFVARRKGGVLIKTIVPDSQSERMSEPPLRKSMWLKKVGQTNVEVWSLSEVLARISAMPRPLEMTFVTAPGKDWSK